MAFTNRVTWELLRSFDTSTVSSTSTFYNVGTALLYPSYKLKMVNNSNALLIISIDGVNSYDVCPANSFWLYDETQAMIASATTPAISAGTQISVQSSLLGTGHAGTGTGSVYLVSQYLVTN